MLATTHVRGNSRSAAALAGVVCSLFLLAALPDTASAATASAAEPETCGKPLNVGLDYFLRSKLFAGLTKVDLPTEIVLPLSAFKIVNLRVTGLDNVSRGCSLQLSMAGDATLRLKACAHAAKIMASFVLKAGGYPVDFVQAALTDTSVSAQATVQMTPGSVVKLEAFDLTLGDIRVENAGITGTMITKLMKLGALKEKVRAAIVTEGRKKIEEELKKRPLPE